MKEVGISTGVFSGKYPFSLPNRLSAINQMQPWFNTGSMPIEINVANPIGLENSRIQMLGDLINSIGPLNWNLHLPSKIDYPSLDSVELFKGTEGLIHILTQPIGNFVIHPPFDIAYVKATFGSVSGVLVENLGINSHTQFTLPDDIYPYIDSGLGVVLDVQHILQLGPNDRDKWLVALSDIGFRDAIKEVHISANSVHNPKKHELYFPNGNYKQILAMLNLVGGLAGKRFIHEGVLRKNAQSNIIASEIYSLRGILP